MQGRQVESGSNQVPVSVISGFLGSGKTTLLNRLIRHPAMADAALIVNEFGEIGIDHALVDTALDNAVVMESGCVCCTIRGDLMDTIEDLFAKAEAGLLPRFSRILIEPTGLADPGPIVHALDQMEAGGHPCRCNAVVTMVDGQQGLRQLEAHEEVARQIAVADVVLVTKTDLASEETVGALEQRIAALSPGIPVRKVLHGEIDPDALFRLASDSASHIPDTEVASSRARGSSEPGDHHHHAHEDHAHGAIRSLALSTDWRVSWPRLRDFLEIVYSLRGEDFLRVKGIIWPEGGERPLLLQGVGNAFGPPRPLGRDPEDGHRTRIVFIFKGLEGAAIEKSFQAMVLRGPSTAPGAGS